MGNLHEGHLDLVRIAHEHAGHVLVTLFVNRLQFLPHEDFDRYPRTLESDCAALERAGVHTVFAPAEDELYPEPQGYKVVPPATLADDLEGHFRPGFFTGVATVVSKLFNIVAPDVAVFGKKDYQQLMVIRQMVRQMALPIRIIGGETVRAQDGLALSSRNGYLSAEERARACELRATLLDVAARLGQNGASRNLRAVEALEAAACERLRSAGWVPDYVAVRKQSDLQSPAATERNLVILGAARIGGTRLIDNLEVTI
jgi:pantoate--beta-alanine ligase